MSRAKRTLVGLVVVAAVGGITYLNRVQDSGDGFATAVERQTIPVQTVVAEPRRVTEWLRQTGVLEATQDVVLTAEVSAKVRKLVKDLGAGCRKGETLLQLDSEIYALALAEAEAGARQAQTQLAQSKREHARTTRLKEKAVATDQDVERTLTALDAATAALSRAQAAVDLARRNHRVTTVRCPFDGIVAETMVSVGQFVGTQTPLARVVAAHELELGLRVSAAQLRRIKVGQTVALLDPSIPGETYQGRVARVGIAADAVTRSFPVEVIVPTIDGRPKPGQVVRARIAIQDHEDALAVPSNAVLSVDDDPALFIVEDKKARRVRVQLGPRTDAYIVIMEGLQPGSEVVVVGQHGLHTGDAVQVVDNDDADKARAPSL